LRSKAARALALAQGRRCAAATAWPAGPPADSLAGHLHCQPRWRIGLRGRPRSPPAVCPIRPGEPDQPAAVAPFASSPRWRFPGRLARVSIPEFGNGDRSTVGSGRPAGFASITTRPPTCPQGPQQPPAGSRSSSLPALSRSRRPTSPVTRNPGPLQTSSTRTGGPAV